MLFALFDYITYTRQAGRYSRTSSDVMGCGFEDKLPDEIFSILRPGDYLLVQGLGSYISWLVMYFTSSPISHVAFYTGDRNIFHATLSGALTEPIDSLFTKKSRVLPVHLYIDDSKREELSKILLDFDKNPYGWFLVTLKAFRIISGRDWPYFRLRFALDVTTILLTLEIITFSFAKHPTFSLFIPPYFMLIGFNRYLWKIKPLKLDVYTAKPSDILSMCYQMDCGFIYDGYWLQRQQEAKKPPYQQ